MTNAVRIPRLLSLCVLWLFAAVSPVWALDPSRPVSSYIRDRFPKAGEQEKVKEIFRGLKRI